MNGPVWRIQQQSADMMHLVHNNGKSYSNFFFWMTSSQPSCSLQGKQVELHRHDNIEQGLQPPNNIIQPLIVHSQANTDQALKQWSMHRHQMAQESQILVKNVQFTFPIPKRISVLLAEMPNQSDEPISKWSLLGPLQKRSVRFEGTIRTMHDIMQPHPTFYPNLTIMHVPRVANASQIDAFLTNNLNEVKRRFENTRLALIVNDQVVSMISPDMTKNFQSWVLFLFIRFM